MEFYFVSLRLSSRSPHQKPGCFSVENVFFFNPSVVAFADKLYYQRSDKDENMWHRVCRVIIKEKYKHIHYSQCIIYLKERKIIQFEAWVKPPYMLLHVQILILIIGSWIPLWLIFPLEITRSARLHFVCFTAPLFKF